MVLPPMRRGQIDITVWSFVSSEEPRAGAFKAASVRYVNATRENLSRADADAVRLARQLKGAAQVQNAAKARFRKTPIPVYSRRTCPEIDRAAKGSIASFLVSYSR